MAASTGNDRAIRAIRILFSVVALVGVFSLLHPSLYHRARAENAFLPILLVGLAALLVIINLHLAAQRQKLREVSAALADAKEYAEELEQFSFFDPQTELFNWRYLDQLFDHQLRWMNRSGQPTTLLLFEVISDRQNLSETEAILNATHLLRSNFRGSDYLVRSSANQFLVLLRDTSEEQAQIALDRLTEKIQSSNEGPGRLRPLLRYDLTTCLPGGSLWEKLRDTEEKLRALRAAWPNQPHRVLSALVQ
jgi:GGDEF domain-containing protein